MAQKLTTDPFPDIMKYTKTNGYGPAQYNGLRSPAKAAGSWGTGSYHKDGRACSSLDQTGPSYGNRSSNVKVRLRDIGE